MERLKLSSNPDELRSSGDGGAAATASGTTGRYLVLFNEGASEQGIKALTKNTGLKAANTADFKEATVDFANLGEAEALVFHELGAAVMSAEPAQMQALAAAAGEGNPILAVEPERLVYALSAPAPAPVFAPPVSERATPDTAAYLRGYRDAVDNLVNHLINGGTPTAVELTEEELAIQAALTWGLQITRVHQSRFSGKGIRVAVLDTGLDLQHPDFAGRSITGASFIPGQSVQDGNGHGTHVTGTACGPKMPPTLPRYGIAFQSNIFAGKVLSDAGSGADGGILAGINWAVTNKCAVVNMSLGRAVQPGEPFSTVYETVAQRALRAGTLIIAAAGNDSNRTAGIIRAVSHPANCPSIMAVGAIDSALRIANFSNRGSNPQGGRVDVVGPGVNVHSTWPMPQRYRTISGTSMATPHATGIAALFAEAAPAVRGAALAHLLMTRARPTPIPTIDEGSGLVQAP